MSSPFLAVTLDAKRRMDRVARALGLDRGAVYAGMLDLWEHVWERKSPAVSELVLASCFGPDARLGGALVAFGFLVASGDAFEVAPEDADRLLLTHLQRVAAGKARASSAARIGGAFAPAAPPAGSPAPPAVTPAADQRTASGGPAGNQLLHPAPSTQHQLLQLREVPAAPPPAFGPVELQAFWNAIAAPAGLPKWQAMPDARHRASAARLREHPERSWWGKALGLLVASSFLRGENERGWRASPDWLLKPGRAESILEGKYADVGRRARAGPDPNAGIVSSYRGVEPTPEEIAEENRRQEEWVNGAG